jgi:two-component system, CitB family, sensor kinase
MAAATRSNSRWRSLFSPWRSRRHLPFSRRILLLQATVLVLVVGLGFLLLSLLLRQLERQRFQERALSVARAIAVQPGLADAVVARDAPEVQRRALAAQKASHALFVVITDDHGIRLAHPNQREIGRPVSTSPDAVLKGREVSNIERGTLGLSARGKVPLRESNGHIVGEVSVGFDANEITSSLWRLLGRTAVFLGLALLLGLAATFWITGIQKRRTFGLEPDDLAELVREREAVLFGVSDAVIAIDTNGVVTSANGEAERLLDTPVPAGARLADLPIPNPVRRALEEEPGQRAVGAVKDRVLVASRRPVDHGGRPLGWVVTIFDRTEVEQLTDELEAIRLMTQALRAQRHEFANRLHTVHGLLATADPADAMEYVSALLDAPDLILADDTRSIASSTIRAFLAGKTAEAAELGVRLRVSDTSWVPQKLLAPVEVISVLGNLVNNALEAAHDSSIRPAEVVIDLLCDGNDLIISVANTGHGIRVDDLPTVLTAGVSTHGADRGLGLAITRGVAESLGGNIEITNAGGDGRMTVFVARLPNTLRPETSPAEAVPAEPAGGAW